MQIWQPKLPLVFLIAWTFFFALLWSKALFYDVDGNLVAGHVNIWGDWAAHFTMATAMAERQLVLDSSPFLIGHTFSYPFAANLISAVLLRLHLPLIWAFIVPSFFFSQLLLLALYRFYRILLNSSSMAVLAACIFLLNGGLGFYYFGQDIAHSAQPWTTFFNPPHEYTRLDQEQLKWINVIDSMVIPQRAFGLGFPLTLLALSLLLETTFLETKTLTRNTLAKLLLSGLILGLMPIIHTHSFLAAFIILACWSLGRLLLTSSTLLVKHLLLVGLTTTTLALPLLNAYFLATTSRFLKWYPGWLALDYKMNWLWFWFKNWSLTPFLALVGWRITQKRLLFLPFFILFAIANLWLFQPFAWDNTKIFIWSSVGFSAVTAYLLHRLAQLPKPQWFWAGRGLAIGLFFFVTLSGLIDSYWLLRPDLHHYVMYSQEELGLANWAKSSTAPTSIWLTGDNHNHWLYNLTGRQSLLTFRGWLWTHGYQYQPIEADVIQMFAYPKESQELFEKYGVDYVVVGPNEQRVWQANRQALGETFPILKQTASWTVYQVSR